MLRGTWRPTIYPSDVQLAKQGTHLSRETCLHRTFRNPSIVCKCQRLHIFKRQWQFHVHGPISLTMFVSISQLAPDQPTHQENNKWPIPLSLAAQMRNAFKSLLLIPESLAWNTEFQQFYIKGLAFSLILWISMIPTRYWYDKHIQW